MHWEINAERLLPFHVQNLETISKRHLESGATHVMLDTSTVELSETFLKGIWPEFRHERKVIANIERK